MMPLLPGLIFQKQDYLSSIIFLLSLTGKKDNELITNNTISNLAHYKEDETPSEIFD